MNNNIRTFILLLIILLLVITSSGCIDIHWAKGFIPDDPEPMEYREFQKWKLDYYFDTAIPIPQEEERPIHINKNTIWMNISIEIYMEQTMGAFRYVEIILSEPTDTPGVHEEFESREYVATAFDHIFVPNPRVGAWIVSITAVGVSVGGINDGYSLEVTTYEPDRRS